MIYAVNIQVEKDVLDIDQPKEVVLAVFRSGKFDFKAKKSIMKDGQCLLYGSQLLFLMKLS